MKNSKKIIYLSLNDLKELGIIKKRSKRRKRHGTKQLPSNLNPNIRSASDYMVGSSVPTQFMNTSNLQSDNLRLNNLLLENKLKEGPEIKNLDNSQIDTLQRAVDKQQNNYYYITGLMEQNRFNQPTHTSPFNSAYVDTIENDNDVPSTFGSDNFKSQLNDDTNNNDLAFDTIYKSPNTVESANNLFDTLHTAESEDNVQANVQQNEEPVKGPASNIDESSQKTAKEMIQEINNKALKKGFDSERQALRDQLQSYNLDFDSIKNNQSAMKSMLNQRKRDKATAIGKYTELCQEKNEKAKPLIIKSKDLDHINKAINKMKNK